MIQLREVNRVIESPIYLSELSALAVVSVDMVLASTASVWIKIAVLVVVLAELVVVVAAFFVGARKFAGFLRPGYNSDIDCFLIVVQQV